MKIKNQKSKIFIALLSILTLTLFAFTKHINSSVKVGELVVGVPTVTVPFPDFDSLINAEAISDGYTSASLVSQSIYADTSSITGYV